MTLNFFEVKKRGLAETEIIGKYFGKSGPKFHVDIVPKFWLAKIFHDNFYLGQYPSLHLKNI